MPTSDLQRVQWLTSSYSGGSGSGGNCIEVAMLPVWVAVRDSKDRTGVVHRHPVGSWRAFIAAIRAGEFGG